MASDTYRRKDAEEEIMTAQYGSAVAWLSARTGKEPDDLLCSPRTALAAFKDALREVAGLAALARSGDPDVRADAQQEIAALQQRLAVGPGPGDVALGRIAAGLRDRLCGYGTDVTSRDDPVHTPRSGFDLECYLNRAGGEKDHRRLLPERSQQGSHTATG